MVNYFQNSFKKSFTRKRSPQIKVTRDEFAKIYRDLPLHMVRSSFWLLSVFLILISFVFTTMNFLHSSKYDLLLVIFTSFGVFSLITFFRSCDIVRKIFYEWLWAIAVQKIFLLNIILFIILEIMFFFSRSNCGIFALLNYISSHYNLWPSEGAFDFIKNGFY